MKTLRTLFALVPDCHAPGHYGELWRRHFYEGLRQAAPSVVLPEGVDFSWARSSPAPDAATANERRAATSDQLWNQIMGAHRSQGLDAVISGCFSADLDPGLARIVVQMGVPWINFFCDSTHRFAEVEHLAGCVSLNWFPEHAAIPRYKGLGVPWVCLPYALNPGHLPELACDQPRRGVSFIGLPTGNRVTQLGGLRLLGCPVEIRGYGWTDPAANPLRTTPQTRRQWLEAAAGPGLAEKIARRFLWPLIQSQVRGPVPEADWEEYLRQTEIILGLNQGRDPLGRHSSYLKFRDVEFPGYGCCYLTEHNQDLAEAFEVGSEILTFRSIIEARDLIARFRRQPKERKAVGLAGRRRVLAAHTWAARLPQLAKAL